MVGRENAFFILEIFRATHRSGLGGGYIPRRWRPQPQRTRTDCARQTAGQAVPEPGQTMQETAHTPGRWTRCTGLHSIPDRPRGVDRNGCGRWRAWSVSGKVYNFGRLFLSIFIWIYFAESIDNPHIYGYNIISPDKYGLQPH